VIWTGERNRQQGRLVASMYRAAAGVPCERSAVIAGGLPGADKDAALDRSSVDRSRYLTVSIDAVLDQMAGAGLIPESDGLSPLMQAGQVHAEAQHVAKRVLLRALTDGRNLILDMSLASWRAAEAWTYALRFADYTLTAVFADIGVDEAVRLAGEAHRRGEEEFRRGHGHGGRVIPAAAIRALASPIATAAGNRIRWAIGARSAGAIGGTVGTGAFPGSAVTAMLRSYREGLLSLDDLSLEFRARRWPRVQDVCPPELEPAREAIDDPEPYVPGSFDDVVLAYDLGWLSDADYDVLAVAADGLPGFLPASPGTGERGAVDRARHPAPMQQVFAGQTPHHAPAYGPVPFNNDLTAQNGSTRFLRIGKDQTATDLTLETDNLTGWPNSRCDLNRGPRPVRDWRCPRPWARVPAPPVARPPRPRSRG
jgi:hypothetical protein